MASFFSKLVIIAILVTSTFARDIRFHPTGGCYDTAFVQCGDAPAGFCCTSNNPLCAFVQCYGCVGGNDIYSFDRASCSGAALNSCREGADAHCCIGAGNKDKCAGQWFFGGQGGGGRLKFARMADNNDHGLANELLAKRDEQCKPSGNTTDVAVGGDAPVEEFDCEISVEPNMMSFKDNEGKVVEIHIPTGSYAKAVELFVAQNWDELSKFPAWNNQKYTAADYIIKKKK